MSASELPQSEDRGLHKQREESSTMLRLIKRLKNMEESFRSTRSTVQVRCQELEDRESQVADHRRNLDVLKAEADKRAVELEKLIQERRKEERHLDSLKVLIKEKKDELEIKERMIGLKEGECESIQERMKDGLAKVSRIEKEIEEKTVLNEKLSRTVEVKGKVLCLHRRSGEEWSRKLEAKGRQLEELSRKIELKRKQLEPRVEEIHLIENRVNECLNEIELRERSIHGREESMKEWSSKLEAKGKELEELSEKIELKERECSLIDRRIQERTKKLNWVERRIEEKVKEVECKEQELTKYHEDIKLKVEQVGVIDGAIVERQEMIESKEEEVRAAQILLEELERRIRSKEEKLTWIEKGIEDSSKLAKYKEEEVRVIQGSLNVYRDSIKSKESALDAILESMEGKKKEYDEKEEQIKTLQRLIEDCEKELILKDEKLKEETLKVKEYSLLNKATEEWSCKLEYRKREVELKEKQLESKKEEFKIWVEERGKELNSLERKLKEEARELELAKKQCSVVVSQVKIGTLENSPTNNANISSSASDQSNINITDGKSLQLFMAEHTKGNDSVSSISSFLQQESSEPGKLVLNAMQGFYPSNLSLEKNESDVVLIRRTCILLLDELKKVSPQINPELRDEAKKCASDWKAKMKVGSENLLEILGFLWLVTTYELSSSYDGKELQHLLDVVAQHEQAMGLFGAFGTTDKTPGNSNISSPIKSENRVANTEAISSSQSIQQHTATTIDARHMQGIQNELFREAAYSALKGIIYDLIGKKRLTEAVGLIYTLKLFDKFPPAQILKEYVENGKKCCVVLIMKKKLLDEKDKITEEHVADLRVVIQCIKDYNLESEYPPEEVERQIVESERYKKLRRQKTSLKNVELEERIEQKEDQPTSGAKLQEMAEHKTSKALKNVKQNASSKVEKQKQLQAQKAVMVEQQGQQQEQTNAKLQGKAVQKASASKVEQQQQLQQQEEQKTSKAKQQEKLEHKASNKVEEQQQLQQRQEHKTSKDKQQQQNVEQNASYRVDEQQQQQEKNASKVNQQEQQVQKASEVKQQQTNGNKRSFTFAPRFDHQQKFINNKFQRTSIVADRPFRLHLDHPDYPNPSPSTWRHGSYGYQGQFGPAFNNYEVHANHGQFGIPGNGSAYYGYGGRDPRLNQSYPYPPRHPPH